jgi:DNA-binding XRE family transcriptional regulator
VASQFVQAHLESLFDELIAMSPNPALLLIRPRATIFLRPICQRMKPLPRKPTFARYLRDARLKRRLSVVEVAEQVGVSPVSIYYWENDRVRPRDENLSALCKVLKLPIKATREMAAG